MKVNFVHYNCLFIILYINKIIIISDLNWTRINVLLYKTKTELCKLHSSIKLDFVMNFL